MSKKQKKYLYNNLYNKGCYNVCRKEYKFSRRKCLEKKIENYINFLKSFFNNDINLNRNRNLEKNLDLNILPITNSVNLKDFSLVLMGDKETFRKDIKINLLENYKTVYNDLDLSNNSIESYFIHLNEKNEIYQQLPIRIKNIINFVNKYIPNYNNKNSVGSPVINDLLNKSNKKINYINIILGEHKLGLIHNELIPILMNNGYGGITDKDGSNNTIMNKRFNWKINKSLIQIFDSTEINYKKVLCSYLLNYLIATERFIIGKDTSQKDKTILLEQFNIYNYTGYLGWNYVRNLSGTISGNNYWFYNLTTGDINTYTDSNGKKYYPFPNNKFSATSNGFDITSQTYSNMIKSTQYNMLDYIFFKNPVEFEDDSLSRSGINGMIFPEISWAFSWLYNLIQSYCNYSSNPKNFPSYIINGSAYDREQIETRIYYSLIDYAIREDGLTNSNMWLKEYLSTGLYTFASLNGSTIYSADTINGYNVGGISYNNSYKNNSGYLSNESVSMEVWSYRMYDQFVACGNKTSASFPDERQPFLEMRGGQFITDSTGTYNLKCEWTDSSGFNWIDDNTSKDTQDASSNFVGNTLAIYYGNFAPTRVTTTEVNANPTGDSVYHLKTAYLGFRKIYDLAKSLNDEYYSELEVTFDDYFGEEYWSNINVGFSIDDPLYVVNPTTSTLGISVSGNNSSGVPLSNSNRWLNFYPVQLLTGVNMFNLFAYHLIESFSLGMVENNLKQNGSSSTTDISKYGLTRYLYLYSIKAGIQQNDYVNDTNAKEALDNATFLWSPFINGFSTLL